MEAILTTDADRLEGAGIPLRIGERDVRVRFSMRSMKALEERYGSLHAANEQVQMLLEDNGDNVAPVPKPYTTILPLVAAGLLHEGITEDALADALSPGRFVELRSVLVTAINESFPDPGKAEEADAPTEASPGLTSTTSSPSDSVAAMASSGT